MILKFKFIGFIIFLLFTFELVGQTGGLSTQGLNQLIERLEGGEKLKKSQLELRNINFDINRAELSASDKIYLSSVAKLLETSSRLDLRINGYADPFTDEFEDRLAEERAEAVLDYLLDEGVDFDRIISNNYSNEFPIVESDSIATDVNRRVEISIIKEKEIELNDIIVMRNGREIKADVVTANVVAVRFKDSSEKERRIDSKKVREVRFENGEILSFEKVKVDEEKETKGKKIKTKSGTSDLDKLKSIGKIRFGKLRLKAPKIFGKNAVFVQTSYNFNSNLGFNYKLQYTKTRIPPLSASVEYGVTKHIGLGLVGGYEQWGSKSLELWFNYQLVGLQAAFHVNLGSRIDPYAGVSVNYRRVILKSDPRLCGGEWHRFEQSDARSGWGIDPFVGMRYLPNDRWGIVGEIGSNKLSKWRLGITYLLVKKHFILEKNKPK